MGLGEGDADGKEVGGREDSGLLCTGLDSLEGERDTGVAGWTEEEEVLG